MDWEERPIVIDPYAVEQILRNLVANALAVSPEDEPVTITITGCWQGEQPAVRIEVRDRGPGIDPAYVERIFEPFFSTRSRGTGLGLPIARHLAEVHGGSLALESTSAGTTAILILPEVASGESTFDPENQPDHRRHPPSTPDLE